MAQADELILSDVRCFQGEQRGRVRPITPLIGENSTGKSTFLGCYSVVHQLLSRFSRAVDAPDFNNEPFSMGSFRDIVRYLEQFLLVNHRAQHDSRKKKLIAALWPSSTLISLAPLRAKPKRTYDPVKETASPEGDHVPMLMMRLDHLRKSEWRPLHDDLVEFGSESGLFSDIKVRHHGKQISDPFQLQVKVHSGLHANIMDVGYGVSQSLSILVDLLASDQLGSRVRASRQKTFLLQQPEVHLHPRGQAELASFFASIAQKRGCRFLIETHSDYIIDRTRILVRQGILKESDVSIIFFEPQHNSVAIHNISLDKYGNLQNAPPSYRDFFLKETDRLLGFEA